MNTAVLNNVKAVTLIALGLAIAAMGIYVAEADDAPGAAAMALLLLAVGVVLGVKAARNRLPTWAGRTALAVGIVLAAVAALLTRGVSAAAPLFPRAQEVPSIVDAAPSPRHLAAVERARELVRTAVLTQNLPGVSVAVGAGGAVIWAEGFGWRDAATQAPVTPHTRFNIGTAASAVTGDVAALGLVDTGAEAANAWSPEAIGEEGEDFPPLALLRHAIWQPLGLMPAEYPLPGERATFYVPSAEDHNPRRGRRLMAMRHLACCASGMAFYSTPSDLVRFALAENPGSVNGELAGGMVMSLAMARESGVIVAVTSNIAHADTSALAQRLVVTFAEQAR